MANRLFGILVVVLWLVAMAGLVQRDLWPALTARQPPPTPSSDLIARIGTEHQYGIFKAAGGARIGTSWLSLHSRPDFSRNNSGEASADLESTTYFDGLLGAPPVFLRLYMHLLADGSLDSFNFEMVGLPEVVKAEGESYGNKIACIFKVGPIDRQMSLDAASTALVGDSFQRFSCLPDLEVGQAWRMQMIDPMALFTSGSSKIQPRPQLVRVTRKETVEVHGKPVEAFVVESDGARAWVDDSGLVVRQEIDMPLIGRLVVKPEVFSEKARTRAMHRVRSPESFREDASH